MARYDVHGNVVSAGGGTSNIAGKRVHFLGDSNLQYIMEELKAYLEDTYGCAVTSSAYAGATWETTSGADTTENSSGVGQTNRAIANVDSSNLLTDYDCIVVMLGTNCTNEGELTDTSANLTTMCGAMKYCMEKLCYYGRQIPIGVIIPIRSDGSYTAPVELPSRFRKIEQIARLFNVPTLNLYTAGRIIPNGMTPDGKSYYLADANHMGANGKLLFKETLGRWIAYGMWGDAVGAENGSDSGQNVNGGLSAMAVNLLMDVFSLVQFHTNPTGKLEALKEALLAGSSGDTGGGGSGGDSGEDTPDEPTVTDDITVSNVVMTIVSVGSAITVSDGVMTIA